MLVLGENTTDAADATGVVKNGTDASFMEDVIEASKEAAIIVDFHAEWCGPCKTLGPTLEHAVRSTNGRARMVKIDIDKNPQFAAQLRVQSIPAVFAFVDGKPVDGFMGAVSNSEANAFVERVSRMGAAGNQLEDALDAADEMLDEGAAIDAAQTFAAILEEDPQNARAVAGLARAFFAAGQIEQAKAVLDATPPPLSDDPKIAAVRAQIALAEESAGAAEATAELEARLEADPNDHQARYDLSLALLATGNAEGAIDALLELFRRDREWQEEAAKTQLFKVFESLGDKDPAALKGRRRLTSMIYA